MTRDTGVSPLIFHDPRRGRLSIGSGSRLPHKRLLTWVELPRDRRGMSIWLAQVKISEATALKRLPTIGRMGEPWTCHAGRAGARPYRAEAPSDDWTYERAVDVPRRIARPYQGFASDPHR